VSVEGYRELRTLEKQDVKARNPKRQPGSTTCRDQRTPAARCTSYVDDSSMHRRIIHYLRLWWSALTSWLGGMSAAAVKRDGASILIIVFSMLLLPTGLHAIGGWHAWGKKVPARDGRTFQARAEGHRQVLSLRAARDHAR